MPVVRFFGHPDKRAFEMHVPDSRPWAALGRPENGDTIYHIFTWEGLAYEWRGEYTSGEFDRVLAHYRVMSVDVAYLNLPVDLIKVDVPIPEYEILFKVGKGFRQLNIDLPE